MDNSVYTDLKVMQMYFHFIGRQIRPLEPVKYQPRLEI